MLRQELSGKVNVPLKFAIGLSTFIVGIVAALLKVSTYDTQKIPFVSAIVTHCHNNAWWIILTFTIIGFLAKYGSTHIGSPDIWQLVQYLLDQYREEMFGKDEETKEEPEHFHRVTLYKYDWCRWALVMWPWSGWVVPVARSGSTTKTKIPCFRASRNEPDKAEGVAGQTWVRNRRVPVFNLPNLNIESPSEPDIEEYAKQTFVSEKWMYNRIQKHKKGPQARSLLGIPLETKGKSWGVLVVDSRSQESIGLKKVSKSYSSQAYYGVLSRLLEKL